MADVITLGEAMLRLSPPRQGRLETATSFDAVIGGSELNVAAALAHLGRSVQFLTKLPRSPLGRLVLHRSHEHGVRTDFVVWSDDRLGLYFYEVGLTPRPSQVLYDRAESAASRLTATEIDWSTVFHRARIFHTSGITAALSPASFQTVRAGLQAAQQLDLLRTFDLNYRSRLWTPEAAADAYAQLLPWCSVVFASAPALRTFFHMEGTPSEAAHQLARDFGLQWVVLTERQEEESQRGRLEALAVSNNGHTYHTSPRHFEIADRLGGGDAFVAGFLDGLLDHDIQQALDRGLALAAFKHTIPGEFCVITREELTETLSTGIRQIVR